MGSSCSSCSSGGPEISTAIEGEIRVAGEYRKFSDGILKTNYGMRLPHNGTLELTENCNFRCIHCYQGMKKGREILSGDQWCKVIDEAAAMGTFWMLITGGEPLLHPEFERIYMHCIKSGIITTVFTNARLVTDRHIQMWKDYPPFAIETTLYGSKEETYRKVTGSVGAFAKVIENVKKMKAAGLPIKLKSVAFKPLIYEMAAIKKIAEEEVGVIFKFDTKIDPGIYGDQFDDIRPTAEESVDLEEALIGTKPLAMDLTAFKAINEKAAEMKKSLDQTEYIYKCGAGKNSFYVDYRGYVHPCGTGRSYDEESRITQNGLKEIWDKEIPKIIFQEAKKKNTICQSCDFRSFCDTCPTTAKLATGDKEGLPLYICQHTMMRKKRFMDRHKDIKIQLEVSHAEEEKALT